MRAHGRPRNSVVPSYRPLQWGDVAEARPLSPGSGEGPRHAGTRTTRGEERAGVPSHALAAGPVAPDRRLGALGGVRVLGDRRELGPVARVRRVAHPTLTSLRREKLLHRKDGASRQHVVDGAPDRVRENRERLPCAVCLLEPRQECLPLCRVAEEQHRRF